MKKRPSIRITNALKLVFEYFFLSAILYLKGNLTKGWLIDEIKNFSNCNVGNGFDSM